MKKITTSLLLILPFLLFSQQIKLLKGTVNDNIVVNDTTVTETFAVYLPESFDIEKTWPVIFVLDMDGNGLKALKYLKGAADSEGYILASSNNLKDFLSISQNVLIANRMFNEVYTMFKIKKNRSYTLGFSNGARFASIIPTLIKGIDGVISCGASVANLGVLDAKRPFYFIGIVGRSDYSYIDMLDARKYLDKLRFPNQLLIFDGGHEWPEINLIRKAMRILTISQMEKVAIPIDKDLVQESYENELILANNTLTDGKPLLAENVLTDAMRVYRSFYGIDSLKNSLKILKRSESYKTNKRIQKSYFLKESFTKDDYNYYLEEDVAAYNYNNLGWWNFQMSELDKLVKSNNPFEKRMAKRLRSYINALIDDNIDFIGNQKLVDLSSLDFLYMLKTITDPKNFDSYLKIISSSSKAEDYGTALFYLEELLKNGFQDKAALYDLEDSALLRVTPEFNELIDKYFNDSSVPKNK
jgi:hypothetical protein